MVLKMSRLQESAFGLSPEELEQIHYSEILKKRKEYRGKRRFSDYLSPEAQIAMTLAEGDCKNEQVTEEEAEEPQPLTKLSKEAATEHPGRKLSTISEHGSENSHDSSKSKSLVKNRSFAELYDSFGRMEGDITDVNYDPMLSRKRALNCGKVESAMEIVENVFEGGGNKETDEFAIDEIAMHNSFKKCAVWMEFGEMEEEEELTGIRSSNITE